MRRVLIASVLTGAFLCGLPGCGKEPPMEKPKEEIVKPNRIPMPGGGGKTK